MLVQCSLSYSHLSKKNLCVVTETPEGFFFFGLEKAVWSKLNIAFAKQLHPVVFRLDSNT